MIPINMNVKQSHEHKSAPLGMEISRLKENKLVNNMKRNIWDKVVPCHCFNLNNRH